MKIRLELEPDCEEDEIVIRCRELSDAIVEVQRQIAGMVNTGMQLAVTKGDADYFLSLGEILFLETDNSFVAVHTAEQIFTMRQRLYELEQLLPGSFMRVSKSTIINTAKIRAIHKNITGASQVEFAGTNKKTFVSRNYFKALMEKLEEKRLKA